MTERAMTFYGWWDSPSGSNTQLSEADRAAALIAWHARDAEVAALKQQVIALEHYQRLSDQKDEIIKSLRSPAQVKYCGHAVTCPICYPPALESGVLADLADKWDDINNHDAIDHCIYEECSTELRAAILAVEAAHRAEYDSLAAEWHAKWETAITEREHFRLSLKATSEHERLAVAEALRRAADVLRCKCGMCDEREIDITKGPDDILALIPADSSRLLEGHIAAERLAEWEWWAKYAPEWCFCHDEDCPAHKRGAKLRTAAQPKASDKDSAK